MGRTEVHNGIRYSYEDARRAGFPEPEQEQSESEAKHEAEPPHDKAVRAPRAKRGTGGRNATRLGE